MHPLTNFRNCCNFSEGYFFMITCHAILCLLTYGKELYKSYCKYLVYIKIYKIEKLQIDRSTLQLGLKYHYIATCLNTLQP